MADRFLPAAGEGTPRIEMYGYVLEGDSAILSAIAENAGAQVHVWGQFNEETQTVAITGWEPFESNAPVSEKASSAASAMKFASSAALAAAHICCPMHRPTLKTVWKYMFSVERPRYGWRVPGNGLEQHRKAH
jgi:hypothetical protein